MCVLLYPWPLLVLRMMCVVGGVVRPADEAVVCFVWNDDARLPLSFYLLRCTVCSITVTGNAAAASLKRGTVGDTTRKGKGEKHVKGEKKCCYHLHINSPTHFKTRRFAFNGSFFF